MPVRKFVHTVLLCAVLVLVCAPFTSAQNNKAALAGRVNDQQGKTPANLKTVKLVIKGMHCEGCVSRVSRYLKKERGVTACTVNLETGIAEVTFNPGKATEKRLIAAVKKAGYTAVVQS